MKIPKGWEQIRLREVIHEINDRVREKSAQIPVLSVTNIGGFQPSREYFSKQVFSKDLSNYKLVRERQFAYNPSRVNVGSIDLLKDYDKGALSPMYVVFSTDEKRLLPKFLRYWTQTERFNSLVKLNTQGTVRDSLNFSSLGSFPFLEPPLPEQRKIMAILGSVDETIEKTKAVIEELKEVKKNITETLLTCGIGHKHFKKTKFGEIPVDWSLLKLQEIVPNIKGSIKRGPFGGAIKKDFFVSEGYKIYEQKNVIYNDFELGNYYINKDKFDELKDFEIKGNDLLISCSGTIGKIVLVPSNVRKGIMNQALLKITLDQDKIIPAFFKHLFESDAMQRKVISHTHGSAMKNIVSVSELKRISFVVPTIEEQKKIVAFIDEIDFRVETEQIYKLALEQLKKGLMQVLLTGEKRVRV